jgi:hypothetical protein
LTFCSKQGKNFSYNENFFVTEKISYKIEVLKVRINAKAPPPNDFTFRLPIFFLPRVQLFSISAFLNN